MGCDGRGIAVSTARETQFPEQLPVTLPLAGLWARGGYSGEQIATRARKIGTRKVHQPNQSGLRFRDPVEAER